MAKWTNSDSGILRKSEFKFKEKKEDLLVFGYTCKLFREDEKALHIDQGKHLIPWMGDETLKIDRENGNSVFGQPLAAGTPWNVGALCYGDFSRWYDARGALHDLSALEAPSGGYDWRVELTKLELDIEQMCDEERYRALHTNEDEEEMYREEELKRLHAAGYGQVGFNYDSAPEPTPAAAVTENDEPFVPTSEFQALFPTDVVMPETQKLNAIIEKTAKFIATQGIQMEILLRAKQAENPQFLFLNKDSPLHQYYTALINLVKTGKWPPRTVEEDTIEEKQPEEDYLHPSLGATIIESAPSIPSIQYKRSADCAYTMLVSKMRGEPAPEEEPYAEPLAPGEVAPPGTEPTRLPPRHHIARAPVMYAERNEESQHQSQQYAAYYQQYVAGAPPAPAVPPALAPAPRPPPDPTKSTGLSLMKNYNTDSEDSDMEDASSTSQDSKTCHVTAPPDDVQLVIDKMAAYVARNGDEFEEIVRAKHDPRFNFLNEDHVYHPYYRRVMLEKREGGGGRGTRTPGKNECNGVAKPSAPVSFSIKKQKEPDPVLPKPALPYESSSDEESDTKQVEEKTDSQNQDNVSKLFQTPLPLLIPPAVLYRIEAQEKAATVYPIKENLYVEKAKEVTQPKTASSTWPDQASILASYPQQTENGTSKEENNKNEEKISQRKETKNQDTTYAEASKDLALTYEKKEREEERDFLRKKDKKKHKEKKKEYRSRSGSRESKRFRKSPEDRSERKKEKEYGKERDREKEREKERDKEKEKEREKDSEKRHKKSYDDLENEIISIEENDDELIDLTGDMSDTRECDTEESRAKKAARRQKVAELWKQVHPTVSALPTNTLASAMVQNLEIITKKKEEEDEKRRQREKRRHRDRYDRNRSDGEGEGTHRKTKKRRRSLSDRREGSTDDYDSSKRRRRRKEKKLQSTKTKKKKNTNRAEEEQPPQLNIDLSNTLRGLRSSPTRALLPEMGVNSPAPSADRSTSSSEEGEIEKRRSRKKSKRKENREYSEGEWSSDSDKDSVTSSENECD